MTDLDGRSDAELLALTPRDPDAFAAFYRRHARAVLVFLARRAAPSDVGDLTAEVFATALVSCRRYDPSRGAAGAWLAGIAMNKLADLNRRGAVEARMCQRLGIRRPALSEVDLGVEFGSELRRAARRRVRVAVARAPGVSAGAVSGVCAVAVCLAVVFALLQIAPARRVAGVSGVSGGSRGSGGSTAPLPAGARALVSELAVMRRPQTEANRIGTRIPPLIVIGSVASRRSPGPKTLTVVPSLTRLVAKMPRGRRLYLAIGRVAGGPQYVVVWLETPFLHYVPIGSKPDGGLLKPFGPQGLLASPALTAQALVNPRSSAVPEGIPDDAARSIAVPKTWVEIVPDTVARARWTIQYPGRRNRVAKTLPVSNNVALLRVAEGQLDEVWSISWLAPDGHVLATLTYPTAFQ